MSYGFKVSVLRAFGIEGALGSVQQVSPSEVGDHWILNESLEPLLREAREARFVAGRSPQRPCSDNLRGSGWCAKSG